MIELTRTKEQTIWDAMRRDWNLKAISGTDYDFDFETFDEINVSFASWLSSLENFRAKHGLNRDYYKVCQYIAKRFEAIELAAGNIGCYIVSDFLWDLLMSHEPVWIDTLSDVLDNEKLFIQFVHECTNNMINQYHFDDHEAYIDVSADYKLDPYWMMVNSEAYAKESD
ncbi:hypothetical protein [Limosilactobacillus mucosae]|uniref:Uncharacterized protein n=1 Tax=Limosilactobacillus mucosae TaxID=97478 RepID=A0AAJ1M7W9_LIMMU|nr:hypothetical protein [Limosilactobacillus mucosae]MDC2828462.1 hypothetical protein [Limosilactobacillus mucosae]MDC2834360.1 hypothetical protein [Limosilactobacillus mucosae]